MMFYPEEVIVTWLALRLARPVKWIEDRRENFFATTQERGQIHDAEFAFAATARFSACTTSFCTTPAPTLPTRLTVPINSSVHAPRPLSTSPTTTRSSGRSFTNKPIVTPYRGAGRQHGVFVMERHPRLRRRRDLGLDPVEIRRRNYLPPDAFPHDHQIIYQDFKLP